MAPLVRFLWWSLLSLLGMAGVLAITWSFYDVDEFVNLQQALLVASGLQLYTDAPSNHPPGFTWFLWLASQLPGSVLLGPRVANTILLWATGLLVADLFQRHRSMDHARWFLLLWTGNLLVVLTATRASNEVPVLFLLNLAGYVLLQDRFRWTHRTQGIVVGLILAASFLFRYSTAWYAPVFLLAGWARVRWILAGGVMGLGLALAWVVGTGSFDLASFYAQTIGYHTERYSHPFWFRFSMILLGTGTPFLLILARRKLLWTQNPTLARIALVTWLCGWSFLVLPMTWLHYLLPMSTVLVACLAELAANPRRIEIQKALPTALIVYALLVSGSAAAILEGEVYPELEPMGAVAEFIRAQTPEEALILTDHAELSILSGRGNWGGYYWTLREYEEWPVDDALDQIHLAALRREGTFAVHPTALDRLASWPCLQFNGVELHWNPGQGAAPTGFHTPDEHGACPAHPHSVPLKAITR